MDEEQIKKENLADTLDKTPLYKEGETPKKPTGRAKKADSLDPGNYIGTIDSTRVYASDKYGDGMAVNFTLDGMDGLFQKTYAFETRLPALLALFKNLGLRKENGGMLEKGGDVLRCTSPRGRRIEVSVRISQTNGHPFFANIYPYKDSSTNFATPSAPEEENPPF